MVVSLGYQGVLRDAFAEVSRFRTELYACLTARGDALFELCDALLCTDGPVRTHVDLALAPEHRRGHGALYAGLNNERIDVARLRRALVAMPLPRAADGRIVPAADVSPWLRPDTNTCPDRSFCHTFGRGEGKHQMVPGWPYSTWPRWRPAARPGRQCWTRSAWSPARTSPQSPRSSSARLSSGSSPPASGSRAIPRSCRAGCRIRRTSHRPPAERPAR